MILVPEFGSLPVLFRVLRELTAPTSSSQNDRIRTRDLGSSQFFLFFFFYPVLFFLVRLVIFRFLASRLCDFSGSNLIHIPFTHFGAVSR